MKKTCRICQNTFDFCPECSLKGVTHKQKGYCSEACYDISNLIQRYACNLATANNTVEALKQYNIEDMQLQPVIEEKYRNIKSKVIKPRIAKPKLEVAPIESVEVVIANDEDTATSKDEE